MIHHHPSRSSDDHRSSSKKGFLAFSIIHLLLLASLCAISPAQEFSAKPGYAIITADHKLNRITQYNAAGKTTWQYDKVSPIDVWAMPDGTVLTAYLPSKLTNDMGGVRLIAADKSTIFDFPYNDEIMSAQPLTNGNFLIAECHKGRVTELDRTGKRIHSFKIKTEPSGHRTMRQIRLTPNGTIIIGECYSHKLREYDRSGKMLKEFDLEYCYCPQPQPNGNILVACWNAPKAQVLELDPSGKTVWRLSPQDLPEAMKVSHIAESIRLPSGNTLVSASCKASRGSGPRAMLFEVTPEKKVVWQLTDPDSSTLITAVKQIPSWTPAFPNARNAPGSKRGPAHKTPPTPPGPDAAREQASDKELKTRSTP
jgi:hypothetical protein